MPVQPWVPIPDMDESAGMEVEEPGHVRARTQPIDNHGRTDSGGWANKSSILLWKRGGWCLRDSSKPCSSPDARTPAGSQCLRGRARTLVRFEVTSGVGVVLVLDGHVLSVNIVPHHPLALQLPTTTITLDGKHGRAQKWESPEASSHSCLSQKSHWVAAWDSSEELLPIALNILEEKEFIPSDAHSAARFLAKERWDLRTFIVFDIFYDTYNPHTAHLAGQDNLPVILVSFGKKKETASIAGTPMRNKVNSDIRALHNSTGPGSRPPFAVDHADGQVPFYTNPRNSVGG